MDTMQTPCDGEGRATRFSLSIGGPGPLSAVVAAITNEGEDIFITLGIGDHTSQRWLLTPSLARKLRRELNERLD